MSASNNVWARREAISRVVNLKDLAVALAGVNWRDNTCSCCFHGRDSKPSMYYYPNTNQIHCFGCPPGEQHFDVAWFVKQLNGWPLPQTLSWLEKEYRVKASGVDGDESEDEKWELTWKQLSDRYLREAHGMIATVEERLEIRRRYWDAFQGGDKLLLARMLGRERVEELKAEVFGEDDDEGRE